MGSKGRGQSRSSSHGKSRKPSKRVAEGLAKKTTKAGFQCKVCGRWFDDLKAINTHYAYQRHPKRKRPPKGPKFDKITDERDIRIAEALIMLRKNPEKFKRLIREAIKEKMRRREYF